MPDLNRGRTATAKRLRSGGDPPLIRALSLTKTAVYPLYGRSVESLPYPCLPILSSADQRQSRTPSALRAPELPLRPQLRRRRQSQCAGPPVARPGGQCARPRHHEEAPRGRFERDERAALRPLASRPYRSLVLVPEAAPPVARPSVPRVPEHWI